jgi:signal transduction histidine kinase
VKSINAKVSIEGARFVFNLQEPKARFELSTDKWGHEPLRNVNQGRYGLGLNRMRIILEAHNGNLGAQFDRASSVLATTITLPLSHEETG